MATPQVPPSNPQSSTGSAGPDQPLTSARANRAMRRPLLFPGIVIALVVIALIIVLV